MRPRNTSLAPHRIALIRASWSLASAQADALTIRFYSNLFDIDPGAARLFHGVDMAAQRTKLAQSLAVVVNALDDLDRVLVPLQALGKRHTGYGVEFRHFESVGAALVGALETVVGEDFTPEVRDAWVDAYGVVVAAMQEGMRAAAGAEIGPAVMQS